jgi:ABC-type bacteriocin/lantibiotic exporter with double-glycine peptidase domain
VTILGESGSGKSSLIDILIGIRKPSEGSIEWGCTKNHPNCYCHGEIGFVPQKYNLIRGSLRENILLGRGGIEDFEIIRLMNLLGLSNLLSDSVEGLDTQIGDGAKQLSGGEAQRIALIAALISRPKILVLDEATSALDVENQRLVMEYLEKELHEITLIMVTHQPNHYQESWSTLHLRHGCVSAIKKE